MKITHSILVILIVLLHAIGYSQTAREYVRSFKVNGKIYNIPILEVKAFLADFPKAKEIQTYLVGKDTLDIPIEEVVDFINDMPDAKQLHKYDFPPKWEDSKDIAEASNNKPLTQLNGNNYNIKLYNHLIDSKRVTVDELGDFKTFNTLLSEPANAIKLYKNLIKKGFKEDEIGNQSVFLANIDHSVITAQSKKQFIPQEALPSWDETTPINDESISIGENKKSITQNGKTDTSILHFQTDKFKIGGTFVDLPIPSGFVKVDSSMGILLESAIKLCPKANTLLAYYISEEDYANFLVSQDHLVEKYILVEVINEMKNKQIGSKDYRQFINSFKNKYVEEFKQLYEDAGHKVSKNLSNLDEKINVKNIKMEPLGLCYESKNSISYGILSKYNFSIENESSTDYVVAVISTITKIKNKPLFLFIYKTYHTSYDISAIKAINLKWIKEIDNKQLPASYFAKIDFEDYKESILAILTLSFIWAIYFATKKIQIKMRTKNVSENLGQERINDFVDFDELLNEDQPTIIPLADHHQKKYENTETTASAILMAGRGQRLLNSILDILFLYMSAFCIGYTAGYFKLQTIIDFMREHPTLSGLILYFTLYFLQEYIFGKTLGKFATETHVSNRLGKKPTFWQLIIRTAIRFIPFEAVAIFGSDKMALHDSISDTYVIQD